MEKVDVVISQKEVTQEGYVSDLKKNFSRLSLLGVSFGLANSWFGVSASLSIGIASGGPLLIVYGLIIVFFFSLCVAATLSELISAYPNSGGQYYWTFKLAPAKYKRFLSFACGTVGWIGSIFTSASITLTVSTAIVATYSLNNPNYEIETWHIFLTFELFNVFVTLFNLWSKPLPTFTTIALCGSLTAFTVSLITCLSCSSGSFESASFVFKDFTNGTGWSTAGIAFIVGLVNPTWCFAGIDASTHLSEEVHQPERKIPFTLMTTVCLGFSTAFVYCVSMFFCITDRESVVNSALPILEIFYQATGSKAGAIVLESLLIFNGLFCNISSNTWQSRLCWSFSRDRGIPGSRWWSRVHPNLKSPINAHIMSNCWVAVIGCIYMGSTTAYNAIITACILLLYISYSIPTVCLLIYGRNNIPRGPFFLGKLGLVCNVLTLIWTLFCFIFYAFPSTMPVEASSMNYVACVYVGVFIYIVTYWFLRGKRTFVFPEERETRIYITQSPKEQFV
ncbi:amino acid transporter [Ascoidea rubescens DSM 1968]|uniref:Amino acid transporter n=1 Tax=Ascoidea rubescens DSM 1968 TaxID=1344418 RepID=A0A1D2V8A0_9ASCO|nr:amino acid transporter [Ascoidea rubescens DSM 1968]XP_020046304.1 amino acid transporter [Ascoidea rubescens DSM 1968]XP_020046305.1 amino acid transporter [Ascoidea rubescens DSM 1968]ODV57840.1 amino acid transporter [Ascoidea rubescens DSM 1968]ODV59997.1 amino acid transporter [Ascoidea rubescens DSM 1968]ODV59998.1 amino acid transporter [Ascoidea rubescens DSM 1968]